MEYNITGKISFDVDFDIISENNVEEVIQTAKAMLASYYHLDVNNAYHNNHSIDIDAIEYEE